MESDPAADHCPQETKRRLLIVGASGLLGTALSHLASARWVVHGIYRHRPPAIPDIRPERQDITDFSGLRQCFSRIRPHAVIHAAAVSNARICEAHPADTARVNIDAASTIAELCADRAIPCVFTSSDLVFDGLAPPYSEASLPTPICAYGEQKALAEQGMRARYPDTTICRLPLLFGHVRGTERFFSWMVRRINTGLPVSLFLDEFRTPVDTASAAAGLLAAIDMPGITLHLGGRTRISRYDIGRWVERILGVARSCINPVLLMDTDLPTPRPPDVSLVSNRAYAAGYAPMDFGPALAAQVAAIADEPMPASTPGPLL